VSPLWRDEVGIYLAQRRICLVRIRRGMRPALAREEDRSELPAEPAGRACSGCSNGSWRARKSVSDARVRVVIATSGFVTQVVPCRMRSVRPRREWPTRANSWPVFLASHERLDGFSVGSAPGASRLAAPCRLRFSKRCARRQPGTGRSSCRTAAVDSGVQYLASSAAGRGRRLFVTVEEGTLAALRMCGDGIDRVHAVRIGSDWAAN